MKKLSIKAHVVTAAFPDIVNPVLEEIGIAATVRIGNIDLLGSRLTVIVLKILNVPLRSATL